MNTTAFFAAVALAGAGAAAQNLVHNGDFEIPGVGVQPQGWAAFNSGRYRAVGDGLGPVIVRSGTHSIELASGESAFVGYTTDVFNPSTGGYYNPPYTYPGGPATVTGWYAIPADQPLVGANAGIKLEFRREPTNPSIYQSFESLTINGHTNGQWVQFSMTVLSSQIDPNFPPYPVQVSVLPIRFGAASSTGTIFWDDLTFVQAGTCYANCDGSTTAPALNVQDFTCFLQKYAAGDAYANCDASTQAPTLNVQDFTCFLQKYSAGCP
jgi:hypothetical protein